MVPRKKNEYMILTNTDLQVRADLACNSNVKNKQKKQLMIQVNNFQGRGHYFNTKIIIFGFLHNKKKEHRTVIIMYIKVKYRKTFQNGLNLNIKVGNCNIEITAIFARYNFLTPILPSSYRKVISKIQVKYSLRQP